MTYADKVTLSFGSYAPEYLFGRIQPFKLTWASKLCRNRIPAIEPLVLGICSLRRRHFSRLREDAYLADLRLNKILGTLLY
jgi:hypothetical protein